MKDTGHLPQDRSRGLSPANYIYADLRLKIITPSEWKEWKRVRFVEGDNFHSNFNNTLDVGMESRILF